MYSERTQHVLIQESVGILDIEPPCTKHVLTQYREVCPQCGSGARRHVRYIESHLMPGHWFAGHVGEFSSVTGDLRARIGGSGFARVNYDAGVCEQGRCNFTTGCEV